MAAREPGIYEFGSFRVDGAERQLWGGGKRVHLTGKALDVLLALLRAEGKVVSKRELMADVWCNTFVEENNLTVTMSAVRKALGEAPGQRQFIETVPRRGYRFAVPARLTNGLARTASEKTDGVGACLVGREDELERLSKLLAESLGRSGRIAFVTGEAGSGKTALTHAFVQRAQQDVPDLILATGHCLEHFSTGEAQAPFLELIGGLLAGDAGEMVAELLEAHAPTWCLQFPERFAAPETLERLRRVTLGATHERMLRELGRVLEELASIAPVLIRLEDLHWADPASIDALRRLSRTVSEQRLLVVGTFRLDGELENAPLQALYRETRAHDLSAELRLESLNAEHIGQFLQAALGTHHFPPELAPFILRKTGGRPLFVTRLVQHLLERGDIERIGDSWRLTRGVERLEREVPESIRCLIERKLDSLLAEERRLLQYASIEGEEFTSVVLARLLNVDEATLQERLRKLEQMQHLVAELCEQPLAENAFTLRYRFTHVLYQNVLYAELVSMRKRELHLSAAESLVYHYPDQALQLASQVARHFELGGDFGRAAHYWLHCADRAARAYAYREAIQRQSHAIGLLELQPPLQHGRLQAVAHYKRAWACLHLKDLERASADLGAALEHARSIGDQQLEGEALTGLCHVSVLYDHDPKRADEVAQQAFALAKASGDEGLGLVAAAHLAGRRELAGDSAGAEPELVRVVASARRLGHRPALVLGLGFLGLLHFSRSEFDRADQLLTEATTYDVELRDAFVVITALYTAGRARTHLGRIDAALSSYEQALAWARGNADAVRLPQVLSALAWIHEELGQHARAAEFARQSAGATSDPASGAWARVASHSNLLEPDLNPILCFGTAFPRAGQSKESRKALLELERGLRLQAWWQWSFHLRAEAARGQQSLSQGDFSAAERRARRLLELATPHRAAKYMAIAHRMLAEVSAERGNLPLAVAELEQALGSIRDSAMALSAWKLHAGLGRLAREQGDAAAAQRAYAKAATVVGEIAVSISDESLRTAFLASSAVREVQLFSADAAVKEGLRLLRNLHVPAGT